MTEVLLSLAAGILLGALFALARLPAPAPMTLAGVVAIAGMWIGAQVVALALK